MFLLDVNCLVALAWPNHVHHHRSRNWFLAEGMADWATTPAVLSGFVRVSMNTAVTGTDSSFPTAATLLHHMAQLGSHSSLSVSTPPWQWPDWLSIRVQGHHQVSDAVLLLCAAESGCTVATLDERMIDLTDAEHRDLVQVIPV